jgi:hypothetical protein
MLDDLCARSASGRELLQERSGHPKRLCSYIDSYYDIAVDANVIHYRLCLMCIECQLLGSHPLSINSVVPCCRLEWSHVCRLQCTTLGRSSTGPPLLSAVSQCRGVIGLQRPRPILRQEHREYCGSAINDRRVLLKPGRSDVITQSLRLGLLCWPRSGSIHRK